MVNLFFRRDCSVYENTPQCETPHLTQIAHLGLGFDGLSGFSQLELLSAIVIWWRFYVNMIVFRVWDYRLNHSTSFSLDADVICVFQVYPILPRGAESSF